MTSWRGKLHGEAVTYALVALCFVLGLAGGVLMKTRTVTQQVQVHDSLQQALAHEYGAARASVDGAQVNQQLAGLQCAVYARGQQLTALVCR
jgi:hypothetical protein